MPALTKALPLALSRLPPNMFRRSLLDSYSTRSTLRVPTASSAPFVTSYLFLPTSDKYTTFSLRTRTDGLLPNQNQTQYVHGFYPVATVRERPKS